MINTRTVKASWGDTICGACNVNMIESSSASKINPRSEDFTYSYEMSYYYCPSCGNEIVSTRQIHENEKRNKLAKDAARPANRMKKWLSE